MGIITNAARIQQLWKDLGDNIARYAAERANTQPQRDETDDIFLEADTSGNGFMAQKPAATSLFTREREKKLETGTNKETNNKWQYTIRPKLIELIKQKANLK